MKAGLMDFGWIEGIVKKLNRIIFLCNGLHLPKRYKLVP